MTQHGIAQSTQFAIEKRRQAALSMRKGGATFEQIAEAIAAEFRQPGYNKGQAHRDVMHCLKEISAETAHRTQELRALEDERLNRLLLKLEPQIQAGNVKAIATATRISESRRKLLGLDYPVQLQVTTTVNNELQQLMDRLEAALPPETYDQILDIVGGFVSLEPLQALEA